MSSFPQIREVYESGNELSFYEALISSLCVEIKDDGFVDLVIRHGSERPIVFSLSNAQSKKLATRLLRREPGEDENPTAPTEPPVFDYQAARAKRKHYLALVAEAEYKKLTGPLLF